MHNIQEKALQQELERRILHGLVMEWENALWVLNPSDRARMRKPFFRLKPLKDRLGYWCAERREICLSEDLVSHHPWHAVREVLVHEIAHQFAHEVLGARNAPAHGPLFRKACECLRANPKASGTYPPLDERIHRNTHGNKDRILRRIQKLLALAESKNRHEAESAMTKAHALIAKYNIDLLASHEDRHFVSMFLGEPALRHFREDYHLAGLLQDFYFVFGLWVSAYVFDKGKMGRVLEITGTSQNIKMAAYVHDFVRYFIDSQWTTYNREKKLNRYRKTDFAGGIIEGFRSKLEAKNREKESNTESQSLVTIEDPLLLAYADHKYPHTRSFRPKVSSQDQTVMKDGRRLGKRLVISKGVTEKGTTKTALLGNKADK